MVAMLPEGTLYSFVLSSDKRHLVELLNLTLVFCSFDICLTLSILAL